MRKYIAALLIGLAAPVAGQAEVLECDLTKNEGWMGDKFFFEIDHQAGTAKAYDAVIRDYEGEKPKAVGFSESANKWVFTWKILGKSVTGQIAKMQYRAAYYPARKEIQIRATPGGSYAGEFRGRGTCKVMK